MCDHPIIDIAHIMEELEIITQPLEKQGYAVDILQADYNTQTLTLECEISISACGVYTNLSFRREDAYGEAFISSPRFYVNYDRAPLEFHKAATMQLRNDLRTHNSMHTLSESVEDVLKDILAEKPKN